MSKTVANLNESEIANAEGEPVRLVDPSASSGHVTAYFRDVKEHLLRTIDAHDVMLGCVAWLTDRDILCALAGKRAQVIVQKEDFLRPDSRSQPGLREAYERIEDVTRYHYVGLGSTLSICAAVDQGAVRCVGNHNSTKSPAHPRMHHKFAVFGDFDTQERANGWPVFRPRAVWTGSFNWTHNATQSLENAVFIKDAVIAAAYTAEFEQVFALSEPLDWETSWMAPEYRIGS